MQSIRKSFKSYGSFKQSKRFSGAGNPDSDHEQLPILLEQERNRHNAMPAGDYVVKIDDAANPSQANKIWRDSSYDFWRGEASSSAAAAATDQSFDFRQTEDPPSQLIGRFLHKQRASGEMQLDMDLEMEELQQDGVEGRLTPVEESPVNFRNSRELKVSFDEPLPNTNLLEQQNDTFRRRHSKEASTMADFQRPPHPPQHDHRRSPSPSPVEDGEVLRCTSNASFERNLSMQRKSALLKAKTRSRLLDPPEEPERKSGRVVKSGQLQSGILGKKGDEEDDDPFLEEDFPDEFKKTHFSLWILLEWVSLFLITGFLIATLCIPFLREKHLWQLKLWKWEVMVLVLICGRLVSDWVIRIAVYCIERNFLLRKRVLYFVYGVKKAVQNCVWLGLVLIAWHLLFDQRVQRETNSNFLEYVNKVLVCFLVGTLVWLLKTLMVKVLASSFHVSTYFDRIQESLFNQYVIETLSGPPLVEIKKAEEEEERLADEVQKLQNAGVTIPPDLKATAFSNMKSGRYRSGVLAKSPRAKSGKFSRPLSKGADDNVITIDNLNKLNPNNISAWNMKRLMNMVRHGALSTLDEQILDSANDDENATQIRSENEAKVAAKKIFHNVARRGCRFIYPDDLMRFMQEDEAAKTMNLFEGASDSGKISKAALKNWVVNAFRERRALALTLNDTKTAVNKLHRMLNFIVGIVVLIIWLLILELATTKFLVFLSSQIVLVTFIFGNTCKTIFEAIIFLFVMHPFDVGDRCEIDGIQMIVEEMNILTTIFLKYDNHKVIIPNSVLATKAIFNYYRSPDMQDIIEFYIHVCTPVEKISLIKHRISSFCDNKKEHWYPSPTVVVRDHLDIHMVKMAIWPNHRMNFQDQTERHNRRSLLLEELIKIFRELDLNYRLLPLDVNVRAVPTSSERLPPSWQSTPS
ncbi:mechanosensitive ion channel protein 6-like [Vigna unguiculata]|uniref:mechanosensitive ion channel protein 6-like n=1 Tax=Vigna unguiculata TaxID=3917 RepID=UPI001015FB57|nr:mechanosensitive ion channel protein 6-like [Vigna unguiculata]XP_027937146.1 mechanosensitive ion channel protein 6-like [Vigna unguiculata]